MVAGEVGAHARAQADTLADVERQVVLAIEQVDPRRVGNQVERLGADVGRQAGLLHRLDRRLLHHIRTVLAPHQLHEIPQHAGIAERTVARVAGQAMARQNGIQAVAVMLRVQGAGQLHRA